MAFKKSLLLSFPVLTIKQSLLNLYATPAGLLKFAKLCGVKTSLLGLRHQSGRLGQLLTVQTPDHLVDALSHRIDHFHILTFGGIRRTRDWLLTRQSKALIQR